MVLEDWVFEVVVAAVAEVAQLEDTGSVEDEEAFPCLHVHLAEIAEAALEQMAAVVVVVELQVGTKTKECINSKKFQRP